jgi:predicted DNA-binding protein
MGILKYELQLFSKNMTTKARVIKQLNIKIPNQELLILEAFTENTERTKTDVIREFIRALPTNK